MEELITIEEAYSLKPGTILSAREGLLDGKLIRVCQVGDQVVLKWMIVWDRSKSYRLLDIEESNRPELYKVTDLNLDSFSDRTEIGHL